MNKKISTRSRGIVNLVLSPEELRARRRDLSSTKRESSSTSADRGSAKDKKSDQVPFSSRTSDHASISQVSSQMYPTDIEVVTTKDIKSKIKDVPLLPYFKSSQQTSEYPPPAPASSPRLPEDSPAALKSTQEYPTPTPASSPRLPEDSPAAAETSQQTSEYPPPAPASSPRLPEDSVSTVEISQQISDYLPTATANCPRMPEDSPAALKSSQQTRECPPLPAGPPRLPEDSPAAVESSQQTSEYPPPAPASSPRLPEDSASTVEISQQISECLPTATANCPRMLEDYPTALKSSQQTRECPLLPAGPPRFPEDSPAAVECSQQTSEYPPPAPASSPRLPEDSASTVEISMQISEYLPTATANCPRMPEVSPAALKTSQQTSECPPLPAGPPRLPEDSPTALKSTQEYPTPTPASCPRLPEDSPAALESSQQTSEYPPPALASSPRSPEDSAPSSPEDPYNSDDSVQDETWKPPCDDVSTSPCPSLEPGLEDLLGDVLQNEIEISTNDRNIISEPLCTTLYNLDNNCQSQNEEHIENLNLSNINSVSSAQSNNFSDEPSPSRKISRKRKRQPDLWKKVIKKIKRNRGEEYKTDKGKNVPARKLQPPCNEKCRLKCFEKLNEDQRVEIFTQYWSLGDLDKQRNFINFNSQNITPRYRYQREGSNRKHNLAYYLPAGSEKLRVCKKMFKATLNTNDTAISTAHAKRSTSGNTEKDNRCNNRNKISNEQIEEVKCHINAFPRIESHYLRAQTEREYLDGSLTLTEMYRLYLVYCAENNLQPIKEHAYRNIFNTSFNIGFFHPKKDQCSVCAEYDNSSPEQRELIENKYQNHIKHKNEAREEMKLDIEKSREPSSNSYVFCYDLQAVLNTPCGEVSSFYYKRKLATFNFTIYNNTESEGHCYVWNETIAKRGCNEIGSMLLHFIRNNCNGKNKSLIFFSDNCCGQNKNRFIFCLYLYIVMTLDIPAIYHKFLTVGHTQNTGDSMHSVIEKQKKRALSSNPIYIPAQWVTVIQLAKKTGKPYKIHESSTEEVVDLKVLVNKMGTNYEKNTIGEKVYYNDIKEIFVEKASPLKIFYKTAFSQETYNTIDIRPRRRGKQCNNDSALPVLTQAYRTGPKISEAKKRDLLDLCQHNLIPQQYHNFYNNLST